MRSQTLNGHPSFERMLDMYVSCRRESLPDILKRTDGGFTLKRKEEIELNPSPRWLGVAEAENQSLEAYIDGYYDGYYSGVGEKVETLVPAVRQPEMQSFCTPSAHGVETPREALLGRLNAEETAEASRALFGALREAKDILDYPEMQFDMPTARRIIGVLAKELTDPNRDVQKLIGLVKSVCDENLAFTQELRRHLEKLGV